MRRSSKNSKGGLMKKLIVVVLTVLMVLLPCAPAVAEVPTCVLGGPTAMDTNRQLAEGETFVLTDRPLVVNLQFRSTKQHPERVGECMLPSGTEVAIKNGILQWVKACGNNEVNQNIFVIPFKPPQSIPGRDGRDGKDGRDGRDGKDFRPSLVGKKKSHTWLYVVGGILLAGGVVAIASRGGKSSGKGPDVTTLPPN